MSLPNCKLASRVLRMWGTNQWWQMPYGYQYQMPTQGSSEDWAAKAAMWAQHRRVQEQTQQYYSQAALVQPAGYHGDVAQYQAQPYEEHGYDVQHNNHQNTQEYPKEGQQATDAPPLPPEPEPTPPGLVPEEPQTITDNMEMVAMEAEAPEAVAPTPSVEGEVASSVVPMPEPQVNAFDTRTTLQLPPHTEYCPSPPSLANRETFDHNHGFDAPPPPTQPYSVPQQIDYGHQSASAIDYNHQRQGPVVFDYSRQYDTGYQQQLPGERYFPPAVPPLEQMPQTDVTAAPSSVDYSGLSDVKKKGLPLWIREGLEKMEKQKRKQESATLNTSTSSLSSISGYKHSSTLSPAASPKGEESDEASDHDHPRKERGEDRSSDEDEEDDKPTLRRGQHLFSRSEAKSSKAQDSADEADLKVDDVQREQNLVLNIRRLLTEILLTVTNDEITNIAQEAFDAAHKGSGRNLKLSGSVGRLGVSGVLGLAGYGSDSGSESDAEVGNEDRKQRSRSDEDGDDDDNREHYNNSRKSRSQKHRDDYTSDSSEEHTKSHRSSKRRKKDKRRRSRSRSSDESDRSSSTPERKKSRRSKHSRRERSRSSSPKRRSKRSRKSRSRSRSPKKHKSRRKSRSRSRSSSESDSRSGSKHKRSKGDEKRKKRSSSRRSPASPGGKRDRRQKSRSRSRSSSPRRGKH